MLYLTADTGRPTRLPDIQKVLRSVQRVQNAPGIFFRRPVDPNGALLAHIGITDSATGLNQSLP
jgi:hypothetical protein